MVHDSIIVEDYAVIFGQLVSVLVEYADSTEHGLMSCMGSRCGWRPLERTCRSH